jgi:TetR/AcrR family transcriptional regulator, lmrAB and yxaGH operons repressor
MTIIIEYDDCHSQAKGEEVADVRQRMIQRTVVLLARKGLQGTSFSQILEESGAPRGSLYHHFPGGKDELVLAALEAAGEYALDRLDQLSGKPALAVAEAFIDLWRQVLIRSEFGAGCAIAAVTVAAEAPALRERAGDIFRQWRAHLSDLFELGGLPKGEGAIYATSLIAACEGGVILSRGEGSIETFEKVVGQQIAAIVRAAGTAPPQETEPD